MKKLLREQPDDSLGELEENNKQNIEAQEYKAETVNDFIDCLKWSYDEAEDEKTRRRLAHQIIKIEVGLSAAKLNSREVKVSRMPDGVLGLYDLNNNQIEISEDMLSDFNSDERLIKTVFVHEKTHKEGIHDEGLTQIRVRERISAAPGIYTKEQQEAKRTFYKTGIDKALDLYDIDHPEKLVDYYLEVEIGRAFPGQKKKLITEKNIDKITGKQSDKLSDKFKDGAEELYNKLESGYIKNKVKEILEKIKK